jgi:hypothetical protein
MTKRGDEPQEDRDEPGAEGGNGGSADVPRPSLPTTTRRRAITDQHSDAQA